jgi:hypothetical protein
MNEINIEIVKYTSKYGQCNFCLSKNELYNIRGDRLPFVATICKKCMTKIADVIGTK